MTNDQSPKQSKQSREAVTFLNREQGNRLDWAATYRGNLAWLPTDTFYVTRHGSHAYGTNLPTSDLDLRGIVVPPPAYYLGFVQRFEQAESKDPDLVVFDVRKFFSLAADANPNALEILFTDPEDHLVVRPAAVRLLDRRDLFLSRKAKHTLSGYATAQMKRINTHYRWLRDPPKAPPTRAECGLPERTLIPKDQLAAAQAAITKQLDRWNLTGMEGVEPATRVALQGVMASLLAEVQVSGDGLWVNAARTVGYDANFIELLDRERRYQGRHREWEQYQTWLRTRNQARAELEEKFGFDTKHGMHLVRLLRTCRDLLTTGKYVVKRPDAEELLAIRAGAWTYERLVEFAEEEDAAMTELVKTSPLPREPDRKRLDALCVEIVEDAWAYGEHS